MCDTETLYQQRHGSSSAEKQDHLLLWGCVTRRHSGNNVMGFISLETRPYAALVMCDTVTLCQQRHGYSSAQKQDHLLLWGCVTRIHSANNVMGLHQLRNKSLRRTRDV